MNKVHVSNYYLLVCCCVFLAENHTHTRSHELNIYLGKMANGTDCPTSLLEIDLQVYNYLFVTI